MVQHCHSCTQYALRGKAAYTGHQIRRSYWTALTAIFILVLLVSRKWLRNIWFGRKNLKVRTNLRNGCRTISGPQKSSQKSLRSRWLDAFPTKLSSLLDCSKITGAYEYFFQLNITNQSVTHRVTLPSPFGLHNPRVLFPLCCFKKICRHKDCAGGNLVGMISLIPKIMS